jgi:hypothetical protein
VDVEADEDQDRLTAVIGSRDVHKFDVSVKDVVGVVAVGREAEGCLFIQERRVGAEQDDVPSRVVTLECVLCKKVKRYKSAMDSGLDVRRHVKTSRLTLLLLLELFRIILEDIDHVQNI